MPLQGWAFAATAWRTRPNLSLLELERRRRAHQPAPRFQLAQVPARGVLLSEGLRLPPPVSLAATVLPLAGGDAVQHVAAVRSVGDAGVVEVVGRVAVQAQLLHDSA